MAKKTDDKPIIEITDDNFHNLIYEVRGQQVMLDADLAQIYGYTTKAFNQQVKNNIEKFDEDFMFQLTKNEYDIVLRSKILTLEQGKYSKYLPYVFTEQGIYMLMTVLKDVASNIKITLFSDNIRCGLHSAELSDFKREYPQIDIELKCSGGVFHDRYIIIDLGSATEAIYHCGASSKDGGKRVMSIEKVNDVDVYRTMIQGLSSNAPLVLP